MDYRPKMVVPSSQMYKHEDDEDEDLEALRLAALKSLKAKPTAPIGKVSGHPPQAHPPFPPYNIHRANQRDLYYQNWPPRQNGNVYYPSRNNQNLIEIVPLEQNSDSPQDETKNESTKPEVQSTTETTEGSKFHRYDDNSGSDDDEPKEPEPKVTKKPEESESIATDHENPSEVDENSPQTPLQPEPAVTDSDISDSDEEKDDDDDDVLLMADLEEEDSLERLMDEMEREMTVIDKPIERKEKKSAKKENRDAKKSHDTSKRGNKFRERIDKNENSSAYRRSVSPYVAGRVLARHRSISPKIKTRKRSPLRRSPPRQTKKCMRELNSRQRSPNRYSPRRSPKLSPVRRSPGRKLSPPRRRSRSRSPRLVRPRSPRTKSPRNSPGRLSPRPRSPRSPKLSPRSRSPKLSPRRATSPSLRPRSPKLSPHRSPWSSPRNSPRLSPRRRRSPIKELPRKTRNRSITPEEKVQSTSPDVTKVKNKISNTKEPLEVINNPVLEARRRKFECNRPIDPVTDNKKIKLSRKDSLIKMETADTIEIDDGLKKKTRDIVEELDDEINEGELSLDNYEFDDLNEELSDESTTHSTVTVEIAPVKLEKERPKKKKKKDKEIYQIGKLKAELPLSERIGKEKKCKKRHKDLSPESDKGDVEEVVEELVDEEADLRTELSRRRAERMNRAAPVQSARLLQSAFKGVVNEAVKSNAKTQRHLVKADDKSAQKEVRRVTVLHRAVSDLHNSEDEVIDSKVPVRFRLGLNKPAQDTRDSKITRKSSKRQSRKGANKNTH